MNPNKIVEDSTGDSNKYILLFLAILHLVVRTGSIDVLTFLISAELNLNILNKEGDTPLVFFLSYNLDYLNQS